MTWPFENDTSAITKKLAKRNLKADKSRNILIIITIALATCLIMTTTLYFFASQRKSLNDAAGRYQAIINEVDNDTITKLVNDSRVQVGVSHLLGLVSYGDYKLTVRSMDETLNLIIRDIRETHKKDSESAPQTTVANELKENLEAVENFKGSRLEKLAMLYCKQLGINYKNLSEEEFRWLIRILQKSKKMGTPISQRKKR